MSNIPSPDDRIGERYRIVRLIGEGGMGAVFEAENIVTHKRVALKWLHPAVAARAESAQRLVREAQAASRIRHSNVVDVYDVITHNGTIFLVLELLEGEPLADVIERGGMPVPEFIALLLQAMRGVAAAHAHGVIHRDVHPGNIFLERVSGRSEPRVKVLDFGISKLDGDATHALTQSGTTMGTPLFMSYEQLCATRDLDVRADVYSFGVILYRALTGQYPYSADTLTELAVQLVTTKPPTVKALRREIPSALDRLVMACVSRERDLRPATIVQLIDELEPFATEQSFRALLSGHGRTIPALPPPHPVTRLHADGASLVPPTSMRPSLPVRPATPGRASSSPNEARPGRWRVPAAIVLALAVLGAGAAALLPHLTATSEASSPTTASPPALPARPVAAAEPSAAPTAEPPPAPTAPTSQPVAPPAQPTPAKPRIWVPRPKQPTPAPAPAADQPYYRSGRPPEANDFK
ncbi:MAG: protein kinase [Polyangiales bacterium]